MKPKRERAGCPICLVKPCESCGGGDACLSCGLPTKSWPIVLRWKLAATRGGVDGKALAAAWAKYAKWFGTVPHGTEQQMSALLELVPKQALDRALGRTKK